jgi:hypothetical protein
VNFKPERALGVDAHGSTGVALAPPWDTGEEHGTWTDDGLTAIVMEGEGISAYAPGTTKKATDA